MYFVVLGNFKSRYPSGGYTATLGRTKYNSYYNLHYVNRKNWIDMYTRLLCLEFLIYNVNYNVFNSVKLIFEATGAGYYEQSYSVCVIQLFCFVYNGSNQ